MATYLLTWNPKRWQWEDLEECAKEIEQRGYHEDSWSCGVTKKICPDDRVFLIKLGAEPRGIVASGWAGSKVYKGKHWDKQARAKEHYTLMFTLIRYLTLKKSSFLVFG